MCDTVVIVEGGEVWFAKNSDRDPNEGQALRWYEAREGLSGAVRCTWTTIAQAERTLAVLLSQPFWLWGAEMGANERGVVIGNEAVFTDQPLEDGGLTGMDLVRLGLERGRTAEEAVGVITRLVERHGQGGRCGLEDASFRYSSSFLVADASSGFVVETAGRRWAAEPVRGVRSISNGLALPAFASRHADPLRTRVACAGARAARTAALAAPSLPALAAMLRDHGEPGWPRYDVLTGTLHAPCMHGGGLLASSQTTASWISRLLPQKAEHWATGTSSPCLSLFKPVRVGEPLDLGPLPSSVADRHSFFWQAEALHRAVMRSPGLLSPLLLPERDQIERGWQRQAPEPAEAWALHRERLRGWRSWVEAAVARDERPAWARWYWRRRERSAQGADPE